MVNSEVLTIFLADDDEDVRRTLKEFFAGRSRYRVIGEAADGADTLEQCAKLRPDIVMLDIQMPLLNGIHAAGLLLAEGMTKCVMMLTAFADADYIEGALAAGVSGYLTKPFDPEKILPTLEVCVEQSRNRHLLKKEYEKLRRREDERGMIDRAKLLLMETRHWSEEEAYHYIRELSRRKELSMMRVAKYLIVQLEENNG